MVEHIPDIQFIPSDIVGALPSELVSPVGNILAIFQVLGIVFIIYFIFLIVNSILNIRRGIMIKKTYATVLEMNLKLSKVLGKKHSKHRDSKEKTPKTKKK